MTIFAVNPQVPIPYDLRTQGVISIGYVEPQADAFEKILAHSKDEDSLILSVTDIEANTLAIACWLAIHNELRVYIPFSPGYKFVVFNRRTLRLDMEAIIDKAEHK